jgi:ligand-binding sensor domain-containing protein
MQDPLHQNIVFAGTTQGLYRTGDAGATWVRTTGPELIVNDVYINPTDSNRMLLATDRGGVLVSNDGGYSFKATNAGFSSRQITSYIEDSRTPGTIYVGLVNDKAWGGAFVSTNGGLTWTQKNAGLEAHDVFSLGQAPDGTIFAGTRHGIYRLTGDMWAKVDRVSLELPVAEPPPAPKPTTTRKGAAPRKTTATAKAPVKKKPPLKPFDGTVFSFTRDGDQIFAATSDGILVSKDSGQSWNLAANPDGHVWYVIASQKGTVFAASLSKASITNDGGKTWTNVAPPSDLTQITSVAVDGFGGLWIGGREGVYLSEDKGASWKTVQNFFMRDVNSIFYDAKGERVLVTANNSTTLVFAAHLPDKKVNYWNTGWNLRLVRPVGDHLVGATLFDGIVIQPAMVNSAEVTKH